jgi:hypothetical protein
MLSWQLRHVKCAFARNFEHIHMCRRLGKLNCMGKTDSKIPDGCGLPVA